MFKVLFAAFLLRLINLNQSLWLDEAISYFAVKNFNFFEIITKFSLGDVHPPLYYLVLKFWTVLFGYSEIALRFPSVIFGVLTVWFVYKLGGKKAAIFMAVNPLAIYYSQEARMYSLATFAITAAVYFFLKKKRFLFPLFLLVALYTDYIPWLVIPLFFIHYTLYIILFLLPWFPIMWQQLQASVLLAKDFPLWGQVVGGLNLKALFLIPIKFIFGRIPFHPIMVLLMTPYFLIIRAKNRFFWLWLIVPIVLGAILSLKIPIFTYHRFLFVLPAFMLLLASAAGKKSTIFIIAISLISLAVFNLNPNLQREDWRSATAYINSDPGKVVMPNTSQSASLTYYHAKMDFKENPVYLVRYVQEIFDPSDSQRILLERNGYKNIEQRNFNGVIIWKYVL